MIDNNFVKTMARYNQWQNESIYQAGDKLGEDARQLDRGAFFGSIHKTLCHLMWGDMLWTSRFAGLDEPEVPAIQHTTMIGSWHELHRRRIEFDNDIIAWADGLDEGNIEGELSWFSGSVNRDFKRPLWEILVQFFNHQTHHRGQVHAMITAAGGETDDTDLILLPMR